MAERSFFQFNYGLEQMPVRLFLKATIGASGAVTLDSANSKGIASITKETAAGTYTVVLQDKYKALLQVSASQQLASGEPASPLMNIVSEDVDGAKTIVIQFTNQAGGDATNMDSGTILRLSLDLRNR